MKEQITYQGLLQLERDIDLQMESSIAYRLFNREKIRRFITQNQHRLSVLHSTMEKLRDKHVKKGEDGKPLAEEIDGNKKWVFADPLDEKKYLDELNEFMQITFDLHV